MSSDEIPTVYTWDLNGPGPCGVSTDRSRAIAALNDALYEVPPGVEGVVVKSQLAAFGAEVGYEPIRTVATASRDRKTGLIVWAIDPKDVSRPESGRAPGRDAHHPGPPA